MNPTCVIAGVVIVGESVIDDGDIERVADAGSNAFARPKSSTLTVPSSCTHVGRLQIAMDDALLVCRLERFRDLPGDRQCLIHRQRTGPDALGQRRALDELHAPKLVRMSGFSRTAF